MLIPNINDYRQIQGNIVDYMEVHMSVCGSGCSCPCKQSTSISLQKMYAGTCSCNCTCGCNCNAPIMREAFSSRTAIRL